MDAVAGAGGAAGADGAVGAAAAASARAPARAEASERSAEPALQRPFTIDPRDVNLNELVSHLLQPTPLSSFLGARRRVVPRRAPPPSQPQTP